MLSCKAFLMNYCWHSVQRLEGLSPREEKADPLSCACCGASTGLASCVQADGLESPRPCSPDSRKGLRQTEVYDCSWKQGCLRAGRTLSLTPVVAQLWVRAGFMLSLDR